MQITKRSGLTGKTHTLDLNVTDAQIAAYAAGGYVQDVFAHLSAPEREFIMTGITPQEWEETFGKDEDEEN